MKNRLLLAATISCLALSGNVRAQTLHGPLPYLCQSDSPFAADIMNCSVLLETFEDGLFNIPGVTASAGVVIGPGGGTDSVDCDDGVIDGSGSNGRSFLAKNGSAGIIFEFTGDLPTDAGIVWTDGAGTVSFEAFDQDGISLGEFPTHPAGMDNNGGQTGEDRFFGASNPNGISSIFIRNAFGGMEVDHLQFSGPSVFLGDLNGDGEVNLLDVAPFVNALTSGGYVREADINCDGAVSLLDVAPFVALLTGG